MNNASSGCDRGSRQPGTNAGLGVRVQSPDASRRHEQEPEAPTWWNHLNQCNHVRSGVRKNTVAGHWRAAPLTRVIPGRTGEFTPRIGSKASRKRLASASGSSSYARRQSIDPTLGRQTRDLASRMEKDLGTLLEWAAVAHYNMEHPILQRVNRC